MRKGHFAMEDLSYKKAEIWHSGHMEDLQKERLLLYRSYFLLLNHWLAMQMRQKLMQNVKYFCNSIDENARSVFDLIPIIITIFVRITNQQAHKSPVDRSSCVAWMSMIMRMKNGNDFEIEYWPFVKSILRENVKS